MNKVVRIFLKFSHTTCTIFTLLCAILFQSSIFFLLQRCNGLETMNEGASAMFTSFHQQHTKPLAMKCVKHFLLYNLLAKKETRVPPHTFSSHGTRLYYFTLNHSTSIVLLHSFIHYCLFFFLHSSRLLNFEFPIEIYDNDFFILLCVNSV